MKRLLRGCLQPLRAALHAAAQRQRRRDPGRSASGRARVSPAHSPLRAQTVAISRFAPPGHGSLATARCSVTRPCGELVEPDLARVALRQRVRRDQPEAAAAAAAAAPARRKK